MTLTKSNATTVSKKLIEVLGQGAEVFVQDLGSKDYTDVYWYGNDFTHQKWGNGCLVAQVAFDPGLDSGNYVSLHFNTFGGDWHDTYSDPVLFSLSFKTMEELEDLLVRAKEVFSHQKAQG